MRKPFILKEAVLRANPHYELVALDQLLPVQRAALAGKAADPRTFGILRPRLGERLRIKSVCHDTADLLAALDKPAAIPPRFLRTCGDRIVDDIKRLVLNDILEVEIDGVFVTGLAACSVLYNPDSRAPKVGRLCRLSMNALRYAQMLELDDVNRLAARVYFYNRVPVSPAAKGHWKNRDTVLTAIGASRLLGAYHLLPPRESSEGWLIWSRVHKPWRPGPWGSYKLYVSPLAEDVSAVFAALAPVILKCQPPLLKMGDDAYGLLRPDKFMVYFDDAESLQACARKMRPLLQGFRVHGVPFSAELGGDGLLSWGMDPPRDDAAPPWLERASWRVWVVCRLAGALVDAKSANQGDIEPWQFALERLRLAGVNTETWEPIPSIWSDERVPVCLRE